MSSDEAHLTTVDSESLELLRGLACDGKRVCSVQGGILERVSAGIYSCSGLLLEGSRAVWVSFESVDVGELQEVFRVQASLLSEEALGNPMWHPPIRPVCEFPSDCEMGDFLDVPWSVHIVTDAFVADDSGSPPLDVDIGLLIARPDGVRMLLLHDGSHPLQLLLSTDAAVVEEHLVALRLRRL